MAQALASCLHRAAVLREVRRDGPVGYQPDSRLLGASLRELQAEADTLSPEQLDLRVLEPLELCARSRDLGNQTPFLEMTTAACLFRSGEVQMGRDYYVRALLKAENRAIRARCLTSIAAIHFFEGDWRTAVNFSQAAMHENPGLDLVQSNHSEIQEAAQITSQ
jgi:hypothetical protein